MDAKDKKEKKERKKDRKKEKEKEKEKDESKLTVPQNVPKEPEKPDIPEDKIIQIPLHLLLRFRNIFEAANSTMHWKTQDLFPVGVIVRDIDRILAAHMNPGKEGEPGK